MPFGIPMVLKHTKNGERAFDIFSRLLEDRIIFLCEPITAESAPVIIAELLHLDAESNEPIFMYIDSPGGVVTEGFGIMDTMNYIKSDVVTICVGQAASMGALLLSCGTKGKRFSLPTSRIMIHQVLGGAEGQATDIEIQTKEIMRLKNKSIDILAQNTGKDPKVVKKDTERDNFMSPEEALKYGLIDGIIKNMNEIGKKPEPKKEAKATTKKKITVKTTKVRK